MRQNEAQEETHPIRRSMTCRNITRVSGPFPEFQSRVPHVLTYHDRIIEDGHVSKMKERKRMANGPITAMHA